jgi:transposase
VIDAVRSGASRREAAERFELSPSSAIKWIHRWRMTGSAAAKPIGGSVSPLEKHAEWLLALIGKQPDLTLDEIVLAMHKQRISGSRSAVNRLFVRHKVTFKKKACTRRNKRDRTSPRRGDVGIEGKRCLNRTGLCSSTRPRPTLKWCGLGGVAGAAPGWLVACRTETGRHSLSLPPCVGPAWSRL